MKKLLAWYFGTPLILRIVVCFVAGSAIGGVLWFVSAKTGQPVAVRVTPYISPFGVVFVDMLKMLVIPVIFFSLVVGAASLPLRKFGRVGAKTIGWYLGCSVLAALVGVGLALMLKPGEGANLDGWQTMVNAAGGQAEAEVAQPESGNALMQVVRSLFRNPFESLSTGNFLGIIVFSILFGLALHMSKDAADTDAQKARIAMLEDFMTACRDVMFRLVEWILEYSPIGVLALSIMNFGLYGPSIVGPYIRVTLGVVFGILVMVFVVYPVLLKVLTGENPFVVLKRIREAMIMAFITRSSAATLPVSIVTATDELKVRRELASFSLPLGATINMDGVCVHLPMFAILAAGMFGVQLTAAKLVVLVLTTVLASIGAGGVPGGSLMLLFIILGTMGLRADQIAVIVYLASGINPILDMFETMNNVTGDLVCTYAVAKTEGLVGEAGGE